MVHEAGSRIFTRLLLSMVVISLSMTACTKPSLDPDDPSRANAQVAQSRALSHLKAADVHLERQTIASAKQALELANAGLRWAPPAGKAKAWTVARLLLVRARASRELGNLDAATLDLEAALEWAARDQGQTPDLIAVLELEIATILVREAKLKEAAARITEVTSMARTLGADGAALQCEALILDGDISVRLGRDGSLAPENLYRAVFEVARKYDYPEDTWDHMDRALWRLRLENSPEANALMGPVEEIRAKRLAEQEQKEERARTTPANAFFRPAVMSGHVSNAVEIVAELRPAFGKCYQQGLDLDPQMAGSVRLTISVGADGGVSHVDSRAAGVSETVAACVEAEAMRAQFNPPEGGSAVISVPVSFVKQGE